MSIAFDNLKGQAYPQQVTALAFRWYEAGGVGDPSQPGFMAPFLQNADGALLISLLGPNGDILLPDDADDVPETVDTERVPTVARLYAFNQGAGTFSRLRNDLDDDESSPADGLPALRTMGRNRLFIEAAGDAWERERGNAGSQLGASAARTVTPTFGTFTNVNHRAVHIIVDVTVIGADTLTVEIQARRLGPPFTFYPLLTSLAISSTGVTVLKVGIGFTPIANLTANDLLSYVWQVVATPSGVDPITYSIDANLSI